MSERRSESQTSGDGALIDLEVLRHELALDTDTAGPKGTSSLLARRSDLAAPKHQLATLESLQLSGGPSGTADFRADLRQSGVDDLRPRLPEIFQINLGKLCNMTCRHCHVDAGPDRTAENMDRATAQGCLDAIDQLLSHPDSRLDTVDLTGGAPELNPNFEYLVDAACERGLHVIDRCNLTILLVRKYAHLPEWLAERTVEVACSMPHYRQLNTDAQRGRGTYTKSLEALRRLNEAGYGSGDPERVLTLVTNPVGAFLAGQQASLEAEWKAALVRGHGLTFDRLIALNNMPISRFLEWLIERGQVEAYMERLLAAFNPAAIDGLMCRNTISVSWDGRLFDCDFNQMLNLEVEIENSEADVRSFDLEAWMARSIVTRRHCYGCTAGSGSSCGGATA